MKKHELLTIGYEGKSVDEFIEQLKDQKVTRVIDVRERPLSHKKGFSKSALQARLEAEKIQYIHLKALGCPSPLRKQYKLDHDQNRLFKDYAKYLSVNLKAILELGQFFRDGTNCLMCFENDPAQCHRSVIVEKTMHYLGKGLKVRHI